MTFVAVFWLVGVGCLIAALAGKGVKIGSVELPAFAAVATRLGAAGVAVMAFALGTVLFFNQDRGNPVAGSAPGGDATTRAGVPGSGATGPAGGPPAPTKDNVDDLAVLWHETMTMGYGSGVDVGHRPPEVQDIIGSSFYMIDGQFKGRLSEWPGTVAPTATECANQLRTHPAGQLRPRAGLGFCTLGDEAPNVAYVLVTSVEFDPVTAIEIDVTVWTMQL